MRLCTVVLTSIMVLAGIASSGTAQKKLDRTIRPSGALLILTQGGIDPDRPADQTLQEKVRGKIAEEDSDSVKLVRGVVAEDIVKRPELRGSFPAGQVQDLPGSYVAQYPCGAVGLGRLVDISIDCATLYRREGPGNWASASRAMGSFTAATSHLRMPELLSLYVSCPDAGLVRPVRITSYQACPLHENIGEATRHKIDGGSRFLEIVLDESLIERSTSIDQCQALLERMSARFGLEGFPLIWDRDRLSEEALQKLALEAGRAAEGRFQVHPESRRRVRGPNGPRRLLSPPSPADGRPAAARMATVGASRIRLER